MTQQRQTEKDRQTDLADQIRQLEGILSLKDQQFEQLRKQKVEVEEQME